MHAHIIARPICTAPCRLWVHFVGHSNGLGDWSTFAYPSLVRVPPRQPSPPCAPSPSPSPLGVTSLMLSIFNTLPPGPVHSTWPSLQLELVHHQAPNLDETRMHSCPEAAADRSNRPRFPIFVRRCDPLFSETAAPSGAPPANEAATNPGWRTPVRPSQSNNMSFNLWENSHDILECNI